MMSTQTYSRILFKKLHPDAKLPTQGKPGDAAFDLYCVEDFTLDLGETKAVSTGLQLANMDPYDHVTPGSLFLQVEGRSGLASKGIFPLGGIIDATYRGEIKVILHNGNQTKLGILGIPTIEPHQFKAGDRIAQMIIRRIVTNDNRHVVEMVETKEVSPSVRGDGGFGSTGT